MSGPPDKVAFVEMQTVAKLECEFKLNAAFNTYIAATASGEQTILRYANALQCVWTTLDKNGYVILRRCESHFPADEFFALHGFIRFRDGLNRTAVNLQTNLYAQNVSEVTRQGHFHTDYTVHQDAPDYIAIECVRRDPRYPYYGRNQVAQIATVLEDMRRTCAPALGVLSSIPLPFDILGTKFEALALQRGRDGRQFFRIHIGYVDTGRLTEHHKCEGLWVHDILEHIAMQRCADFALDQNDVLLVSNRHCLHRRGSATLAFGRSLAEQVGRQIVTTRFIRATH